MPYPVYEYSHWSRSEPEVAKLKQAYEKIEKMGLKEELDILLSEAYNTGMLDEVENHVGADL